MKTTDEVEARKPAGGFVLLSVQALATAWSAYRTNQIRLYDLRVWFAVQETVARRCQKSRRTPHFQMSELHRLVGGVGAEHLRHALRRLERAGLCCWSESAVASVVVEDRLSERTREFRTRMFERVGKDRLVPVPRRMIRLLAGGARRVVIATVLGHLFRCLFFRRGVCKSVGTCKASWIADVFLVDERNAKAARKHLTSLGWLTPMRLPHWHQNRYGLRVAVNLAWAGPHRTNVDTRKLRTTDSPRPPRPITSETPPPESDKELLTDLKNQKPAARGPLVAEAPIRTRPKEKPNLNRVLLTDLSEPVRLQAMFEDAVRRGRLRGGESERIQFFAAAEHARMIGTKNPAGLFAHLVRKRLWHFSTQADEDGARQKLHRFDHGVAVQAKSRAHPPAAKPGLTRAGDLLSSIGHGSLVAQRHEQSRKNLTESKKADSFDAVH